MFKRVDKRRRRQEEEEELGLDAEMKQVLGIQDTDSEESDSDSSDDGGSSDSEGMDFEGFGGEEGEEDEEGDSAEEEEEYESDEDVQVDAKNYPASALGLTVKQVLADSIIPAPEDPVLNFCILCPQKTLRNVSMVQAHKRRLNQFIKHAKDADPEDDALDIIEEHMSGDPEPFVQPQAAESEGGKSKRALKKEKSRALRKERRQQAKTKAHAKKAAAPSSPDTKPSASKDASEKTLKTPKANPTKKSKSEDAPEPSKKKRRVEESANSPAKGKAKVKAVGEAKPQKGNMGKKVKAPNASGAPPPPEIKKKADGPPPSIKNIVRSATNRAKAALAQSRKTKSS